MLAMEERRVAVLDVELGELELRADDAKLMKVRLEDCLEFTDV